MRPGPYIATAVALGVALLIAGPPLIGTDEQSAREPVQTTHTDAETGTSSASSDGIIERVVDGDTVHLRDGRRVRLVQIDTPEVYPRMECGGADAQRALRDRLEPGDSVELLADPVLDDVDQHGRLLRYVRSGDVNLNLWLVEQGHAHPYFFRNARGRYADELLDAARTARAERRGLWGTCPNARLDPSRGA